MPRPLEDWLTDYEEFSDYQSVGSRERARGFVRACRLLLVLLPTGQSSDGQSVSRDVSAIREAMREAQRWLAQASARNGGGEVRADFREFRT